MKPIFVWVGGKRSEIKQYSKYIPDDINTYIEPFCGGAATFFHLNHSKNVISDVHSELIDFYQCIKNDKAEEISSWIRYQPSCKNGYYKIRDDMEINSQLDRAKRFYYLRKTCYRGMLKYNKKGEFNVCYGYHGISKCTELQNKDYTTLLKNTTILNSGFENIFEDYTNPKDFMFLDPPYDCKITNYGYCKFGRDEHKKLAECFKNTKIRCLMIIGKSDFISELYDGYIVEEYDKKYGFNVIDKESRYNTLNAIHLIIKNY